MLLTFLARPAPRRCNRRRVAIASSVSEVRRVLNPTSPYWVSGTPPSVAARGARSAEAEAQASAAKPWYPYLLFTVAGGKQQRIMSAFLERDGDLAFADVNDGAGFDEVSEQRPRMGIFVSLAYPYAKESVETACHESQLQVTVDFHRDR